MKISVRHIQCEYAEVTFNEHKAQIQSGLLDKTERKQLADELLEAVISLCPEDDFLDAFSARIKEER